MKDIYNSQLLLQGNYKLTRQRRKKIFNLHGEDLDLIQPTESEL